MCGFVTIFAYADAAPPVCGEELRAIREAMAARGPHGAGLWLRGDGRIGLAHRRLAIIDPEPRAGQPMASPCGRWRLVYNGEIYNWRELRAELEAAGETFRTRSDTEVLLHWFIRYGIEGLARLRGMYTFALWDDMERCLWLARDPFGIKPLYWHDDGRTLRAASQVRALLAGGGIPAEVEPAGVVGFLLWGSVLEPWTTICGVHALPTGHVLRVDATGAREPRPFTDLASELLPQVGRDPGGSPTEAVATAIVDSVRAHLEADVPVSLFLSSGIDSCALLAALARIGRARYGRGDAGLRRIRRVSGGRGPARPCRRVPLRRPSRPLRGVPRGAAAIAPSHGPARHRRSEHVVRHQGRARGRSGGGAFRTGGDVGGYPSFLRMPRFARLALMTRVARPFAPLWRGFVRRSRSLHPKHAGLWTYADGWTGAYRLVRGLFLPEELPGLLDPDFARLGLERLGDTETLARRAHVARTDFHRVMLLEASWYTQHQLLRDVDWASMAQGLEVRVPFVDVPLWRRLAPLAPRLGGKATVSRALGLPDAILNRPKTGFTMPVGALHRSLVSGKSGVRRRTVD